MSDWLDRNRQFTQVDIPDDSFLYSPALVADSFSGGVQAFVENCCVLDTEAYEYVDSLYRSYYRFCQTQGVSSTNASAFGRLISQYFPSIISQKRKDKRVKNGISILPEYKIDGINTWEKYNEPQKPLL